MHSRFYIFMLDESAAAFSLNSVKFLATGEGPAKWTNEHTSAFQSNDRELVEARAFQVERRMKDFRAVFIGDRDNFPSLSVRK